MTLSADVLQDVKSLGINISKACDDFLRDRVSSEKSGRWKEEHADYIKRSNKIIEEEGSALDQWRSF